MNTLPIAEYSPEEHTFFARTLAPDACSGQMLFFCQSPYDAIPEYATAYL